MAKNAGNDLPDPQSFPELFDSLLKRRMFAYVIDLLILAFIVSAVMILGLVAGIVTLGLALPALVFAVPISIVGYYALTLGSQKRATVGMGMMDIVLTPTRGQPLDGWRAFAHPLVFWITCWVLAPFSLMVALFMPRRQMLHDLIVGVLMVRRSPMDRHWSNEAI